MRAKSQCPSRTATMVMLRRFSAYKWTYFYLYVILDVFSRYVVGWMVAPSETAELAKRLIADTCDGCSPLQARAPRG